MQIKKDEVNKKLLNSASEEFMEKGFEKASIRSIVKNADTTIGNFYNYYKSKEAIFCELVEEAHSVFIFFINNHYEMKNNVTISELSDVNVLRKIISHALKQLSQYLDESLLLLLDKSKGTKYENSKQELIDVLSQHFREHIKEHVPNYSQKDLSRVIAVQLVSGIIQIIDGQKTVEKREKLFTELILFTMLGVFGILQGGTDD